MTELSDNRQVLLRPWRQEDLPVYRDWLRPHHDWHQWDGPYYPRPTDAEANAAVADLQDVVDHHGGVPASEAGFPPRSLVIALGPDGPLCGRVAWYWESRETNWARLGVTVFDPAVRGRGVGSSALALWVDQLFTATDWARLDFATWSGNEAMLRIGHRVGFVEEGRFRDARVVRGEFFDSVVMGMLRAEWQRNSGQ